MCPDWPVPHQGLISRGYSYTLQRNNGESWDLTDSAGNELTAPAVCFMIPPTDPEALALADRYGVKEEELVWCVAAPPWAPRPRSQPWAPQLSLRGPLVSHTCTPFGGSGGTAADPVGLANLCVSVRLWVCCREGPLCRCPGALAHVTPSPCTPTHRPVDSDLLA